MGSQKSIAEMTEAELREALAREQQRTELLLDAVSAVLVGVQHDGTICVWNDAAEAASGVDRTRALGAPVQDVPSVCLRQPVLMEALEQCLKNGTSQHLARVPYHGPGDEQRYLEVAVMAVGDTDQQTGALLAATDITDRLVMESQLNQAQKLEAIGSLAAGIAHEINTPTQFVGDNVRFLRDSFEGFRDLMKPQIELIAAAEARDIPPELVERARAALDRADIEYLLEEVPTALEQTLEGVDRVATIVRAMKEFSHPGDGVQQLTDLNEALRSTATVARNEWKYVAELELDLASDLPLVPCYMGELNQAFLNIIINASHAIAATREGELLGRITISTARDGEWAEIRIGDDGPGIPPEISDRIFEPFFTTKGVGQGTGQGLAIAYAVVVDKHGGRLEVESEPGRGATFVIRLPLSESATQAA